MNAQNSLEVSGNIAARPLPEVFAEIVSHGLSGSLRAEREAHKAIVYFRDGAVVFAVSNARDYRLFVRLVKSSRIGAEKLAAFRSVPSDLELAETLCKRGLLSADEKAEALTAQVNDIVADIVSWPSGKWHFSALTRLRADVDFGVDLARMLVECARNAQPQFVVGRLGRGDETFVRESDVCSLSLRPSEAAVFESFNGVPRTLAELKDALSLPDAMLSKCVYTLWLGGILRRVDEAVFSESQLTAIKGARISLIREAGRTVENEPKPETQTSEPQPTAPAATTAAAMPEISLAEWLAKSTSGCDHYELLGVAGDADRDTIKNSYFSLAKAFHPDRFHREQGADLQQIQAAFAGLARAYETLKTPESREAYNAKIAKNGRGPSKSKAASDVHPDNAQSERALENFEQGLSLLNDEDFAGAAVLLARAVHYSPANALYRAYFGQALAADDRQQHRAETELQAAAKLDPRNAKVRLMLVQFFIDHNMKKRAEGELNRFLEIVPNDREARALLTRLQRSA